MTIKTPINDSVAKIIRELNKAMSAAELSHDWETLKVLGDVKEILAQQKERTVETNILIFNSVTIFE